MTTAEFDKFHYCPIFVREGEDVMEDKCYSIKEKIETERLIIRHPERKDAKKCFKNFYHDKELLRFEDWCYCDSVEAAEWMIDFDPLGDYWILELKDTHDIIGCVEYYDDHYPNLHGILIGWILGKKFQHKGYMTEAVKALNDSYLNSEQGRYIDFISCQYNSANTASEGICRRTGFVEEARLKNRRVDMETMQLCDLVICTIHNR